MTQLNPPLELAYNPPFVGPQVLPPDCTSQYPNLTNGQLPVCGVHLLISNGYAYDQGAAINAGVVDPIGCLVRYDCGPFTNAYCWSLIEYMNQWSIQTGFANSYILQHRFANGQVLAKLTQMEFTEQPSNSIVSLTFYTSFATT